MLDLIYKAFEENDIAVSDVQAKQLMEYAKLLVTWNSKMNLTRVVDDRGIVYRHFIDSLMVLRFMDISKDQSYVDIGTGAGLPGIPLAIMTGAKAVLFDSLKKRINFLEVVKSELALDCVELMHCRAEVLGQREAYRASFDFAFSRAVTQLPVLLEYSVPLLNVGGKLISHKSLPIDGEIENSKKALITLNSEITNQFNYVDYEENERVLIEITKREQTALKYPRRDGIPIKKPL